MSAATAQVLELESAEHPQGCDCNACERRAVAAALRYRDVYRRSLTPDVERELAAASARAQNHRAMVGKSSEQVLAEEIEQGTEAFMARFADLANCPRCGKLEREQGAKLCAGCDDDLARRRTIAARTEELDGKVPPQYEHCRFSWPPLAQCVGGERRIATARGNLEQPIITLVGPSGVGKTYLATALLREWVQRHCALALFLDAGALWDGKLGAKPRAEHVLAPLVLIDDLGEDPAPVNSNSPVKELLRQRYNLKRPTWVTTWLDVRPPNEVTELPAASTFSGRYGDGVARRMLSGTVIRMGG